MAAAVEEGGFLPPEERDEEGRHDPRAPFYDLNVYEVSWYDDGGGMVAWPLASPPSLRVASRSEACVGWPSLRSNPKNARGRNTTCCTPVFFLL